MLHFIDSSCFIALPITFISVFCLIIEADYRFIVASSGTAGLLVGLLMVINSRGGGEESAKINWQRIERLYELLSLVVDPDCSLVLIYNYGRHLSKNYRQEAKKEDYQVIIKLEREIQRITDGWRHALRSGPHIYHSIQDGSSAPQRGPDCNHPVCFFILGLAEGRLADAASRGMLRLGRYVLRSCGEGSAIIDVRG